MALNSRALVPAIAVAVTYLVYRVFFVAAGIHAMTAGVTADLQSIGDAAALPTLRLAAGRLGWSVTGAFFALAAMAAAVVLCISIKDSLRASLQRRTRLIVYAMCGTIAVVAALSWGDNPFTVKAFNPLLDQTFGRIDLDGAALFMDGFVPVIVAITVLLTVAASATLMPASLDKAQNPQERAGRLRHQVRRLNTVLFAGAIVLVTAIVHASVTHRLPGVFCDTACADRLDEFVNLLSASLGAVWTLILLAAYVPAIWIVNNDAQQVAKSIPENDTHKKVADWLADHGLTARLPDKFLRAGALLSPLLVGGPAAPFLQLLDLVK